MTPKKENGSIGAPIVGRSVVQGAGGAGGGASQSLRTETCTPSPAWSSPGGGNGVTSRAPRARRFFVLCGRCLLNTTMLTRRDARRELDRGRLREASSDLPGRAALLHACAGDSPLRGGHAARSAGLKHSKWVDEWYSLDSARGIRERR